MRDITLYEFTKTITIRPLDIYTTTILDKISVLDLAPRIVNFRIPEENESTIDLYGEVVLNAGRNYQTVQPRFILQPRKRYIFEETNKMAEPEVDEWYLTAIGIERKGRLSGPKGLRAILIAKIEYI